MNEEQIREIIREEIDKSLNDGQFKYGKTTYHEHNGTDAPRISASNLIGSVGGTPAGSDTQIQFNDGGSFGGDALLTFDKSAGGTLNLKTHDGSGSGFGGDINIKSGAGGSSGGSAGNINIKISNSPASVGGSLTIQSGDSDSGNAGQISVLGGSSNGGNGNANLIQVIGGNGNGSGFGGEIDITAGNGGSTGVGGKLQLKSGNAGGGNKAGGDIFQTSGNGTGSGIGGSQYITAGNGGSTGNGGSIQLSSGNNGVSGSRGGDIIFEVFGTSGNSQGDVICQPSNVSTTMNHGFFVIPAISGAPTGTPTYNGSMVFDQTNNKFYIWNGAWKSVTLT